MAEKNKKDNYIYAENATFRGDILDSHKDEVISEKRKARQEAAGKKRKLSDAARKRRNRRRLVVLAIFIILCAVIGLVGKSVVNLVQLESEKKAREAELETLQQQIEKDEATLKEVNSDEYIEQQARSELRMIKEGEVLYIINSDGSKTEVDEDGNPVKNENDN
ncbi:MAG: septum formation initiator family protein [Clostridia bacterium]|nr:septum formation initiator family protein [Clostridia bacterium]